MNNTTQSKKKSSLFSIQSLVMMALVTAVICIFAPLSVPIGPVPISLTNLVIYIAAFLLGSKKGTISYGIYLLIGLIGVPVFSGYSGGVGKLVGPTGGYLIGFAFIALITGFAATRVKAGTKKGILVVFLAMVVSTALTYLFGTVWFVKLFEGTSTPYTYGAAMSLCVWPFIPGDLIKMVIAVIVGPQLRKRLMQAGIFEESC